jgi:putative membrane protein
MLLHLLGARYTYSKVPYDAWSKALLGRTISDLFHLERNHYDRLVHLLYGVLLLLPMRDLVRHFVGVTRGWSLIIAIAFLSVFSSLYELLELFVAMLMEPEAAERYNGQQGDLFDAQKDAALAMTGSTLAASLTAWREAMCEKRPANPSHIDSS